MVKKAVILCGGLATRFLPITKSIPKEMLPILNRPAIDYCIEDLRKNGITDILIILGRNKECLENYYDRNIELEDRLISTNKTSMLDEITHIYTDVNITFVRQINAMGTGYAVSLAENHIGQEPFILVFPDELLLGTSFAKQLIYVYDRTNLSVLPLKKVPLEDSSKYGMVEYSEQGNNIHISSIVEKPKPENSPSDICYTGGGVFTSDIFKYIKRCPKHSNGEIYLTDAFEYLIDNHALLGTLIEGERLDFGNPLGFVEGNILAGLQDEKIGAELREFIIELSKKL